MLRRSLVLLSLLTVVGLSHSCTASYYCLCDDGEITSKGTGDNPYLRREVESYKELVAANLRKMDVGERLLTIGHMAGSREHYPKSVDAIRSGRCDVAELMAFSFRPCGLDLDGIEIDVRLDGRRGGIALDGSPPIVYVMHDRVKRSIEEYTEQEPEVANYLRSNRLDSLLETFLSENAYSEKRIYIEIKCANNGQLSSDEKRLIWATVQTVRQALSIVPKSARSAAQSRIAFVSFNLEALKEIAQRTAEECDGVPNLYYIAASNRKMGTFLQNFRLTSWRKELKEINQLNADLYQELREFGDLTGIWFDPCGIDDFGAEFQKNLLEQRPTLEFYLSTYKRDKSWFIDRIKKDGGNLKTRGLILEFDLANRGQCPEDHGHHPRLLNHTQQ